MADALSHRTTANRLPPGHALSYCSSQPQAMASNEADPAESRSADDISLNMSISPTEALESNSDPPPAPRIADDDGADGGNDQEITCLDAEVQHAAPTPPAQSVTPPLPEGTTGDVCGVPVAKAISEEDVQAEENDVLERVDDDRRVPGKDTHLRFLVDVVLATAENNERRDVEQGGYRIFLQAPVIVVEHAASAVHAAAAGAIAVAPRPAAGATRTRHIVCGIMLVAIGIVGGAGIVLGIQQLKNDDGQAGEGDLFDANTSAVNEQALSEKQSLLAGLLDPWLQSIGSDVYAIYETPRTPQYQALKWLEQTSFDADANEDFNFLTPSFDSGLPPEVKNEERLNQRYALAVLYYATTGKDKSVLVPWRDKSNFLSNDHECEWFDKTSGHGVICDKTAQRVIGVNLENNHLSGRLPPDLALLSNLKIFKLTQNNLTGTIPKSFGKLTQLKELNLKNNNLSGSIPSEVGQMVSLVEIHLNGNDFTDGMNNFCEIGPALNFVADCFCRNYPLVVQKVECTCCKFCCAMGDDNAQECHLNVPCIDPSKG